MGVLDNIGITYNRPGYTVDDTYDPETGYYKIFVTTRRPNVLDPSVLIPISSVGEVYESVVHSDPKLIAHWFREQLIQFESHEVDEWLKFQGKFFKPPH